MLGAKTFFWVPKQHFTILVLVFRSLNDLQRESFALAMYNRGQYSPSYANTKAMPGVEVIFEEDDEHHLMALRGANKKGSSFKPANVGYY